MRILPAVAAAAMIVVFLAPPKSEVVEAIERPGRPAGGSTAATIARPPAPDAAVPVLLRPRLEDPEGSELFTVLHRQQEEATPVPAQAIVAIAPTPVAPPLPFRLVGQLKQDDGTVYVLEYGERTSIVSVGETIDGQYVIERADADALVFRYLPLQEMQRLPFQVQP